MEFIKENKVTLIICSSLIGISLIISFIIKKDLFYNNDYIEINDYLKNYKVNEIVPISMNEEQIARKYLTEYLKLIGLDINKAYELLEEDYRDKRFSNIEIFKEHFANLISDKFYNANVSQLNVSRKNNYKEFYIVDANGNTFIFNEYSIMNYKVMFDLTTI